MMSKCKACGRDFSSTNPKDKICYPCKHALNRLNGYAVPVVPCCECKHGIWDEENEMWKCIESAEYDPKFGDYIGWVAYHNADFYCACGERREGE